MSGTEGSASRLVGVDELDETGVCMVEDPAHGALAVGISGGEPFAVSTAAVTCSPRWARAG